MAIAIVMAGAALLVGLPDAGDAGRLLGTAAGVLFLVGHDVFASETSVRARAVLLFASAAGFAGAWMLMSAALEHASPDSASSVRLAASALPSAALLMVPALIPAQILRGSLMPGLSGGSRYTAVISACGSSGLRRMQAKSFGSRSSIGPPVTMTIGMPRISTRPVDLALHVAAAQPRQARDRERLRPEDRLRCAGARRCRLRRQRL